MCLTTINRWRHLYIFINLSHSAAPQFVVVCNGDILMQNIVPVVQKSVEEMKVRARQLESCRGNDPVVC